MEKGNENSNRLSMCIKNGNKKECLQTRLISRTINRQNKEEKCENFVVCNYCRLSEVSISVHSAKRNR